MNTGTLNSSLILEDSKRVQYVYYCRNFQRIDPRNNIHDEISYFTPQSEQPRINACLGTKQIDLFSKLTAINSEEES